MLNLSGIAGLAPKHKYSVLVISKEETVGGQFSTVETIRDNLQDFLDTLYDKGYQPQYLQEGISDNEKADGEYLEFPDFNSSQESPGALNHPSWLNYQKEVFFPPESEYKNIIEHKNDKSHAKLVPLYNPANMLVDQDWNPINPQELREELIAQLTDNGKANETKNSTNLDFLIPIPEFGYEKHLQKPIQPKAKSMSPLLAENKTCSPVKSLLQQRVKPLSSEINNNFGQKANISPGQESANSDTPEIQREQNSGRNDLSNDENIQSKQSNNTVFDVNVAECSKQQLKHEKKNKFSILNLFHKKNGKPNVTVADKGVQEPETKKGRPKSLEELYEQLVNAENSYASQNLNHPELTRSEELPININS